MLALVVADRHAVGLVEEDVAGHQHRVREEAGRDELATVGLVLELRHPAELAVRGDGREQPTGLGVRRHVALREHRRPHGVEPGRDQHREQVERAVVEVARVVVDRDRVQVDDAEERLALLLRLRVLAEAADVVAEVLVARRLDAREDPHDRFLSLASRPKGTRRPSGRQDVSTRTGARTGIGGRGGASVCSSRFGAKRQNGQQLHSFAWP